MYLLLNVIFKNSSVMNLTRQGLSFIQIAESTNSAINSELVTYIEERIVLTDKGFTLLKQLELKYKKINKDEWIEKDFKNKISKLDKNIIFLPKQNELTF